MSALEAELKEAKRLGEEVDALHAAGKYEAVIPLASRSLAIYEKALGRDHLIVATSLNTLAFLYKTRGEYARAEPLYQRALAIREQALGPDHPTVAISLNNLAMLSVSRGEYARAEPLFQRALAIKEQALGPDHPDVATSLSNLALLSVSRGEYARAEPLFQRTLAIKEQALGPDHPDVATSLNNLAVLNGLRGEYDRAELLYQRALVIWEKALGADHPTVATSLNNLAALNGLRGEYARAEPLYQRALAIKEKALGPDHPDVATCLNNLASLYVSREEYARAEPLHQRALAIKEKALGPDHPDVAMSLNNLAELYKTRGEYARAEPLHQRALAIREKALGSDHPDVAASLSNLAMLYWATGRLPEAILAQTRGQDVQEKTLSRLVAVGSEPQKLAFLATLVGALDSTLTLALVRPDPGASRLALTTLLRHKGRALDAMASSMRTVRARLDPRDQPLFDDLQAARSQYTTLALRGPDSMPLDAYRGELAALNEQIRQRESAISARSAVFKAEEQPITVTAIQAAIPTGAALVEWAVYEPFSPNAHTEREKWAPARYAACVVFQQGDPTWIDLGDEATINADIESLRAAFRRPANKDAPALARALEARIMAPVRALLGAAHRVFLSPDGALNLLPFAALLGEDGRPLIERYAFTYLTSGRDLLRLSTHAPARDAPLVLANPDFDSGTTLRSGRFSPLLHAEEESTAITAQFPAATVRLGQQATKARLQQAHGPRFLHIGTHGYFEPMACTAEPEKASFENPLLKSGIALAGANACATGHSEGLLTALEASSLDLYGTRLVVLSACQTGMGDVKAGDGVYGLRRALHLAGAETQVMSLWPVDGAATADLIKAYYTALSQGGGRSEAMRQVQLAMLHDARWAHPYYWAGFIVSGADGALDDQPVAPDLRVHPGGACACRLGERAPESNAAWLGALVVVGLGLARRSARARRRAGSC